ncbi:MAG: NAD(P)/FAD-dependent oxidoreductase [Actinomycetota bacterium]
MTDSQIQLTTTDAADTRPHLVIVGGGFGGLYAARALAGTPLRISLVDRQNYHLFQPLLYQVATALLSPSDIASPIRQIVRRQRNVRSFLGEVVDVKPDAKQVILEDGVMDFDYLIVATGSTHAYFGHDEWAQFAPGLKTVEDALRIRHRILHSYEAAEKKSDYPGSRPLLTYVIVGGGPTGVELAGALSDLADAISQDFRHVNRDLVRVVLVEAGERILPGFPLASSNWAKARLTQRRVEVRTGASVTSIDGKGVMIGDDRIETQNVVWAAGVSASPLGRALAAPLDGAGRVLVGEDLTAPGHPNIFVVGDLAVVFNDGAQVPGVATAAIQQGQAAAANIIRTLEGWPTQPFIYKDKGILATISRRNAVAVFPKFQLTGFPAKLVWLVVHIYFLIGFRNRLIVMIQWFWASATRQRGARLITEK